VIAKLLPLVSQLGNYLKLAIDHYATLKAAGKDASVEVITLFLEEKLSTWDPKVGSKSLLDSPTRSAAARFLAGVAVNMAGV
jgi:hypothetical protein